MASSSTKRNYPRLLYSKGKAPSQQRSMSYYSYLSNFQMVREGVGFDAWEAVKKSAVGVFPMFYELKFTWCAKLVHYLLTNQLQVKKNYEIWSLIDWQPIRLSLVEFGEITGMNCEPFQKGEICDVDHTDFWKEMGVSTVVGPNLVQLQSVLERCKYWSLEKRTMVGLLCVLHLGVYGIAPSRHIPLECAKRVLDYEAFQRYLWGRVACQSLIYSVKCADYSTKESYTMAGFIFILQIWAYESVMGLGELYGNRIGGAEVPLLSWSGSRKRFKFEEFVRQEKEHHEDKVRVRHFTTEPNGQYTPKWDDEVDDGDVINLVLDIRNDCINRGFWDVTEESPATTRLKRPKSVPETDGQSSKKKKGDDTKTVGIEENTNSPSKEEIPVSQLYTLMKTLTGKLDNIDTSIEAKVGSLLAPITEKLATMEKELQKMKQKEAADERKEDANSNANNNENAEVNSKEMSWMVEMNSTSQDGLPSQRVVKKAKKASKKCEDMGLDKKKVFDKKVLKTKIQVPHLLDNASGDETWSDPVQREKLNKPTSPTPSSPPQKRQTKLASSQLFPFVGNSTVKRIITGVTPSVSAYDPFADVDADKMRNLLHFLLDDEKNSDRTSTHSTEFYKVIITPRNKWRTYNYGWLNNMHMWSAMHMFYKRSLCDPSPYHSQRIAFLDQWVVTKIVSDFKEFNPKTWKPTDTYKCIFNGTYPSDRVTNKKWHHDIDHLYACHFVNGNHWVALDIDLGKETITVYDSILTLVDDKEIQNFCRPFAKMIPSILSTMVSATVRKKSEKQFTVRRLKKVPQNDPPGDCGVYTIKYIECLAIGCTFEGLRDETIQDLRRKLAAEIYDSVGEPQITHLFTDTAK
ncbi:hypothetical protein Bca52824_092813 [Brassica carinata]|uniref:Ubiquitin-like protease family profile domain-containing protein n=1 Tax=Brassica carinata TaxID=52824 RepID=A0A8X7P6W7_BRACI|nr:hypothetical protein Bca52824_092813 [Brassica carinata]